MITLNPTNEMQLLMKAADIGQVVAIHSDLNNGA
jgi:hypothetical protein